MEFPRNLGQRQLRGEWMDDPRLAPRLHREALAGLRRINAWTRGVDVLWGPIERELRRARGRRLTLVDLGTGSGDVLAGIARRGGPKRLECHGLDISNVALGEARRLVPSWVKLHQVDVLNEDWPPADIVISSLFLHHLKTGDAKRVLELAGKRARRLVLISDLERSWLAWWAVWAGTHLLTRSPVVWNDGVRSIEAAWTIRELERMARDANLRGAKVSRRVPCRLLLEWRVT